MGPLCGVQSNVLVSKDPLLPAPVGACSVFHSQLLIPPGWPFPGLLWLLNNFTILLSGPSQLSFLLSQVSFHKTQLVPELAERH